MSAVRTSTEGFRPAVGETNSTARPGPSPKGWIVVGFSLLGLLVVVLTGLNTQVGDIPPTAEFGLLQLLPHTYWMGVSLMALAVALAVMSRSRIPLALVGTLFFAVLAGTPVLFEPNPPVWDAYLHLGDALAIGRVGSLPTEAIRYSANWPGSFLVVWFLAATGGLAPMQTLAIFPLLTGGLTFLALLVFLRSFLPHSLASVGSVLGSLLNVWAQFHVSPQSLGLFLALLVLGVVWHRSSSLRTAGAILFVGLVLMHPTSTVLLLGILSVHAVIARSSALRRSKSRSPREVHDRFSFSPALPFGIAWVGWLFFQATGSSQVVQTAILTRMSSILAVPEQTLNIATARSLENILFWAPLIRPASLVVYGIVALLALALLLRRVQSRRLAQFLLASLIAPAFFGAADILAFGGSFYDRSFMLFAVLAPGICLAGISAARIRPSVRRGILAILLVVSTTAASTVYYQESLYFVSDESRSVSEFLELAAPASVVLDGFYPFPVWLDSENRTQRTAFGFYVIYPSPFSSFDGQAYVYAVYDETSELWYRQYRGIEIYEYYLAERENYSLIYTNGVEDIYLIFSPIPVE